MTPVSDADSTWAHTAVSTEIPRMTALLFVWSFIISVHVVADDIDWFWVDNHCYGVAKQTRKGNQFESFCKTGSTSTVADITTLDALAGSKEYSMMWVGAHQVQSGAYQWTTTLASVADGLWSSAAKKTEACVAMTKVNVSGDTTYRLQDWSCDNLFFYLCQSTEACGAAPSSSSSVTTRSTSAAAATSVKSTTIQASSISGTTSSATSAASILTSKATPVVSSATTTTSTTSLAASGTIKSATSAVATISTFTSDLSGIPATSTTSATSATLGSLKTFSEMTLTTTGQHIEVTSGKTSRGPSALQTTLFFLPPTSLTSSSDEDAQETSSKEPSAAQTAQASNRCACLCVAANHSLTAEVKADLIIKELLLQKSALSKQVRKYNSAQDWRPSAIVTGGFGVVCLVVVVALVLTPDAGPVVLLLYRYIKRQCTVH